MINKDNYKHYEVNENRRDKGYISVYVNKQKA